jgi:hypothetical protein
MLTQKHHADAPIGGGFGIAQDQRFGVGLADDAGDAGLFHFCGNKSAATGKSTIRR